MLYIMYVSFQPTVHHVCHILTEYKTFTERMEEDADDGVSRVNLLELSKVCLDLTGRGTIENGKCFFSSYFNHLIII